MNDAPAFEVFQHNGKSYRVVTLAGKVKSVKLESILGESYTEARISFIPLTGAVTLNVIIKDEER